MMKPRSDLLRLARKVIISKLDGTPIKIENKIKKIFLQKLRLLL